MISMATQQKQPELGSLNLDNLRAYQIDEQLYPKSYEVYRSLTLSVDAFEDAYKKNNGLADTGLLKEILLTKWEEMEALSQYEPNSPLLAGNLTKDLKSHYFQSGNKLRYEISSQLDKTVYEATQELTKEFGLASVEFSDKDTPAQKLKKLVHLKNELDKFAKTYKIKDKRQVGMKTRLRIRLDNKTPENILKFNKIEPNQTITLLGDSFKLDKTFMLKYMYELDLYAGMVLFNNLKPASENQILARKDLDHPELNDFEELKNSLIYSSVKRLKPTPEGELDIEELERKYFYLPQLDLEPEIAPEPEYIIEPEVAADETIEQNLENQLAQQYQTSLATSFEVAQKDMSEVNRVELTGDMEQVLQTNLEAQSLLQESAPEPEPTLAPTVKPARMENMENQPANVMGTDTTLTQKITATRSGNRLVSQPSRVSTSIRNPFQTRMETAPRPGQNATTARKTTGGASGPAYAAIAKAQESYDINKTMDDTVQDRLEEKETLELDGHERQLQYLFDPEKAHRMHKYLENSPVVPGTSKLKPI